jgi:type I restriction enzyme S subunit
LTSVDRETQKITDTVTITAEKSPSRAQRIVAADDVIFGTTRPTLKRYCFIPDEFDGQICSTGYCVLRADTEQVLPRYIYHVIGSTSFLPMSTTNAGLPKIC